jgi:hypothetical protein
MHGVTCTSGMKPHNVEAPLPDVSSMNVCDVATWNCCVPNIQLADNMRCDVILHTRVANHELASDLSTKERTSKNVSPNLKVRL